jgi:hypothetical protein
VARARKDAAWDHVTADLAVVRRQGETLRGCADTATSGSNDLRDAQRAVLEAIADGKADGFRVAEDLSVTTRGGGTCTPQRRTQPATHITALVIAGTAGVACPLRADDQPL